MSERTDAVMCAGCGRQIAEETQYWTISGGFRCSNCIGEDNLLTMRRMLAGTAKDFAERHRLGPEACIELGMILETLFAYGVPNGDFAQMSFSQMLALDEDSDPDGTQERG